jgi:polyphosphate kinase 2 (PPK2 family)
MRRFLMVDDRVRLLAKFIEPLRVEPGSKVKLARDFDPGYKASYLKKKEGAGILAAGVTILEEYQARLAAQDTWGVLVCLQALDAGGKDGTIRHVMSGVNPQGVRVTGFKVPSDEELDHDYLWRYARHLPARGEIGVFNRSHYEEVLVVRVHPEHYLADNGFKVIKLFLNLSKEEQRIRFLKRVDLPEKNWKFSSADARERKYWDDYQAAFSDMLTHTSTEWAPWYVVPADHKWFARVCVSAVLAHTLIGIDPRFPKVDDAKRKDLAEVRAMLEAEAPDGAAADPFAETAGEADRENGDDSKQARKRREQMKKIRDKVASA